MTETDHLLGLVRIALDQFEDVPLSASIRRSLRIAMQRGDQLEARFARSDLRPLGGSRELAQSEMKTIWPELVGSESAKRYGDLFEIWLEERSPSSVPDNVRPHMKDDGSGVMIAGSVDEIERLVTLRAGRWTTEAPDIVNRSVMEVARK
jgi:hypothetical protein